MYIYIYISSFGTYKGDFFGNAHNVAVNFAFEIVLAFCISLAGRGSRIEEPSRNFNARSDLCKPDTGQPPQYAVDGEGATDYSLLSP